MPSEFLGREYRREGKFNAELCQVENLVEAGACTDERSATNVRGIYRARSKRGKSFGRSADLYLVTLAGLTPRLFQRNSGGYFIRATDSPYANSSCR